MTAGSCPRNGSPKQSWSCPIILVVPATRRKKSKVIWRHGGVQYRDVLVRVFIDLPDSPMNRRWMREFKDRWKTRLEQVELWMVSYRVDIE